MGYKPIRWKYDATDWEYSTKVEEEFVPNDEGMALTLFEIRSLDETWVCPQEEKL